jgi:hypothetical protein
MNETLSGALTNPKKAENIMNILDNLNIAILDAEEAKQYQNKIEEEMRGPFLLSDKISRILSACICARRRRYHCLCVSKKWPSQTIEREELRAQHELFSIHLMAEIQMDLAHQLLCQGETFDCIVLEEKQKAGNLTMQC